ncbi:hypothetical protein A9K55_001323 [Cordyceps militaris]|uniref:Uncharacterized protein n=1 Tax=Cordyceps militaris TaxID=73501 RepID=A0A2H4SR59_CORMI|nr:hypothetical protein A9K55_001323 [Cordyceps militaris]
MKQQLICIGLQPGANYCEICLPTVMRVKSAMVSVVKCCWYRGLAVTQRRVAQCLAAPGRTAVVCTCWQCCTVMCRGLGALQKLTVDDASRATDRPGICRM